MLPVSRARLHPRRPPGEVLAVGQQVRGAGAAIERTDDPKRPERISLSLKSLEQDPWDDVPSRFPPAAR